MFIYLIKETFNPIIEPLAERDELLLKATSQKYKARFDKINEIL